MNDLISRSELLKAMNTWDKFGCDCHRGFVRIDSTNNEEYVPFVHYEDIVKCVNDMQTAYSINKVVEELEKKKEEVQRMRNTCIALSDLEVCDIENVTYKRAIEIVKQEGVGTLQKNTCKDCAECTQLKCDCSNVRNKAIDDFMNKLCDHCMQQANECCNLECPFCTDGCDIVNISEQLKTGVKNE